MRITLQEVAAKLLAADDIIISAHVNPDGDAIGSSLGLYHLLQTFGKKVRVFIDDDIPDFLLFLPNIEIIEKPDADKYEADLLVLLDVSLGDRSGRIADKCKAPVLNIDHHMTNPETADFLYLDADIAATAEIIYKLSSELGVMPNAQAATCIFTGMATDTGFFRFSNTTPHTMHAAADMIEAGAKPNEVSEALGKRSYKAVIDRAKAMLTIEMHCDGKAAGIFIDNPLYETLGSTEGFVDGVRVIEGVEIAIVMKEVEPGKCRVSMRSIGTDVTKIATAFDGGGHIRAAGCTIYLPLQEAKEQLLAQVAKVLNEEAKEEA